MILSYFKKKKKTVRIYGRLNLHLSNYFLKKMVKYVTLNVRSLLWVIPPVHPFYHRPKISKLSNTETWHVSWSAVPIGTIVIAEKIFWDTSEFFFYWCCYTWWCNNVVWSRLLKKEKEIPGFGSESKVLVDMSLERVKVAGRVF